MLPLLSVIVYLKIYVTHSFFLPSCKVVQKLLLKQLFSNMKCIEKMAATVGNGGTKISPWHKITNLQKWRCAWLHETIPQQNLWAKYVTTIPSSSFYPFVWQFSCLKNAVKLPLEFWSAVSPAGVIFVILE